jgi:hypothetical protein
MAGLPKPLKIAPLQPFDTMVYNGDLSSDILSITNYKFWYDAIIENDHELVQETLTVSSAEEKHHLMNGKFVNDGKGLKQVTSTNIWSKDPKKEFVNMEVNRPWHLAAVFGSTDVLRVLYKEGILVHQLNKEGGNIVK